MFYINPKSDFFRTEKMNEQTMDVLLRCLFSHTVSSKFKKVGFVFLPTTIETAKSVLRHKVEENISLLMQKFG